MACVHVIYSLILTFAFRTLHFAFIKLRAFPGPYPMYDIGTGAGESSWRFWFRLQVRWSFYIFLEQKERLLELGHGILEVGEGGQEEQQAIIP